MLSNRIEANLSLSTFTNVLGLLLLLDLILQCLSIEVRKCNHMRDREDYAGHGQQRELHDAGDNQFLSSQSRWSRRQEKAGCVPMPLTVLIVKRSRLRVTVRLAVKEVVNIYMM